MEVLDDDDYYKQCEEQLNHDYVELRDSLNKMIYEDKENLFELVKSENVNKEVDQIVINDNEITSLECEQNTIIYKGVNNLFQDLNYHLNNNISTDDTLSEKTIHVCGYQINTQTNTPFLQYLMFKYDENHDKTPNKVCFPRFSFLPGSNIDIYRLTTIILDMMFKCYKKSSRYIYKGFQHINNEYYVFFDCSESSIESHLLTKRNDLWLVTIDEMVNQKQVCGFDIDNGNVDFFLKNEEFVYLHEDDNTRYEVPMVGYIGCKRDKMEFISIFGNPLNNEGILTNGSYYYFTDYKYSIDMFSDNNINNRPNGIVRFAIFLKTHYISLLDESLEKRKELLNGSYDSMFISNNGIPYWIIKDYDSQIPLSYHKIDSSFTENSESRRMYIE
jgi:hypothetical protein|tara:strand:- start:8103 stop:9266 length:1164 start_codon:yes stop_codon:yes gene_type:complete